MQELQLSEVILLLVALLAFSIVTYKKSALDLEGILIGNILGIAVFLLGGFFAFGTLVAFFLIGELTTKLARTQRPAHEVRTTGNIVGNGFPSLIMLLAGSTLGFYTAIAAALADTLSSEIGITSKGKPRLITNFRTVEPGTNGAVSLRGLIAAGFGAVLIAGLNYTQFQSAAKFGLIVVAGIAGSLSDSVLGATLERKGRLNNTWVNFFGSLTGALIGLAGEAVLHI